MSSTACPDELLTVDELCEYLKVKKSWVYDMVQQQGMPALRVGRKFLRFEKAAVLAWLRER